MERAIFQVDDLTIANACIAFAKELGLSISDNINEINVDNYLTTGSKNHDVNWIRNKSFAVKKSNQDNVDIESLNDNVYDFIVNCLAKYDENNSDDEVSLDDDRPDDDTVKALYDKVKGQKKSPARYYVVYKNDKWIASTISDNSYGNLSVLMSEIN